MGDLDQDLAVRLRDRTAALAEPRPADCVLREALVGAALDSAASAVAAMEKVVALTKRRGFVYPSSEIYGGLGATFDYGPVGVELKRLIKDDWWRTNITDRDDMVGLDASILMAAKVWEAVNRLP